MAIQIDNLDLRIGDKQLCRSLNLTVKRGQSWAVLGVNGVGKSTLLHHIIGIDHFGGNSVKIDEQALSEFSGNRKQLARKIGLLLQDYEYNFPCTVLESVLIGRHPYKSNWQWENDQDIEIAESALEQVGLIELKHRNMDTLSGGEKRRLNIATLLTQDPDFLLLDEPTNHLDLNAQVSILELLKRHVQQQNKAAIMVMHDANLAKRYCDHVLMLFGNGEWQAGTSKDLINVETLEKLYACSIQAFTHEDETVFLPR